jgi:hypothetical protein
MDSLNTTVVPTIPCVPAGADDAAKALRDAFANDGVWLTVGESWQLCHEVGVILCGLSRFLFMFQFEFHLSCVISH